MSHRLLVVPTASGVGVTSVCLGIVRALDRLGVRFAFVKPVATAPNGPDRSTALIRLTTNLDPPEPIPRRQAEDMLGEGREGELLEMIIQRMSRVEDADVVVVEGMVPVADVVYATRLNTVIAEALDAQLVLVAAPTSDDWVKVADNIDIAARAYGEGADTERCCILNKVPSAGDGPSRDDLLEALDYEHLRLLGAIPMYPMFAALRVKELSDALGAEVVHQGDWERRRIERVALCAATVRIACRTFERGTLIITPGDREDIVLAAALASLEGANLAGLLLTCDVRPAPRVMALCQQALANGLPVLAVSADSYDTAARVHDLSRDVPPADRQRAELVMDTIADHLDGEWLGNLASTAQVSHMTTAAFRHRLVENARLAKRTIVLPEGAEPRTIQAAAICAERGIAWCVLLGDPARVREAARRQGLTLDESIAVVDPAQVKDRYIAPMVELRKHKGLTEQIAANQLDDTVVLGTMMLQQGEVDGLVSGAIHTTANTIRPALQLIKTAPGAGLVSSIFFMCLPEQVVVYGDCAINPNPSAEQLAEIAIQSADSAASFGIEPRVAMISYSTGTSGGGADVDKVALATELATQRRPDLQIDGPLQYDAAAVADVGRSKAPDSPVAGRATVFVFPDLNTGNTTYKAVQRSARVISMGPMLQGLARPVNDLSRGALVDDIVFTIALTAIQAAALDA